MFLKFCTISSSNFSWNSIRFLRDVFLLTIWISDVASKFPSRHGFMADRFVCVSAFLPHFFRGNETVQMFWKEECQPGGPPPHPSDITPISPVDAVVPIVTGKQGHNPGVVAERPDNDTKFVG